MTREQIGKLEEWSLRYSHIIVRITHDFAKGEISLAKWNRYRDMMFKAHCNKYQELENQEGIS